MTMAETTTLLHSLSSLSLSSTTTSPTTLTFSTSASLQPTISPAFAYSNTLFFKRPYNVQVIVGADEPEESLISRFRREVFRANVIQECKRRRFFETNQEMRKRKVKAADQRRARDRAGRRPRPPIAKKEDVPQKKRSDDEKDNWDLIDVEVPYCK